MILNGVFLVIGALIGAFGMGILSGQAYEKGYEDGRKTK